MARIIKKCANCALFEEKGVLGICHYAGKSVVATDNRACRQYADKEDFPCTKAPHNYCNNGEGCLCADYERWLDQHNMDYYPGR